ncbi:MAG: MFS transporter [Alphaproteobacteria bacterium]|nr:MFS transporter [Alphaproteobacteria bacterium]MCB9928399.1 MFS transporter [Alphaproteobacteria bacterium]
MNPLVVVSGAMLVQQMLITFASNSVPVLVPPISEAFGVNPGLLGVFTSVLYGCGIATSVASGGVILRFGAFRMSQFALAMAGLGLLLCGLGWLWLFPVAAMCLGLGMGPSTPASSHILARFATPQAAPLVFSIKQTGVPFGGMLAGLFLPFAVAVGGWQSGLLAGALACWALALALWPAHRAYDDDRQPNRRLSLADVGLALRTAVGSRNMAELAFAGFAFSGLQVTFTSYYVAYLVHDAARPFAEAGEMLAWASAIAIAGRIFWGALAGRVLPSRPLLAFLSWAMVAATFGIILLGPESSRLWIIGAGLLMGATTVSWNGVHLAEVARLAPAGNASVATAGVLFCCFSGLLVLPGAFGAIVAATGDYDLGFYVAAAPTLITGIMLLRSVPRPSPVNP